MNNNFKALRQKEVDENFEAFKKILPTIIEDHRNKFALMKNKKIISYHDTLEEASSAAKAVPDNLFSIQQVNDIEVGLGFYSYASF